MAPSTAAVPRHQEEEAALFSCLCLLDVAHADGAKGVDLGRSMFRKPNAKAFELILYHTYCVVKGKAAAKKFFKGLWPLTDKDRKQTKDFYARVQDWLKESGQLADHAPSLAAFQRNPSGPKLVSFLCDLTDWALCVQHERRFPDDRLDQPGCEDPQLLLGLAEPLLTAAEAHNSLQAGRLLDLCRQGAALQAEAEAAAGQLKELFYELSSQLREAQAQAGADSAPAAAPSLRLCSILPEQQGEQASTDGGSGASGSSDGGSAAPLPEGLQQQAAEVHRLWQQVDGYVRDCGQLQHLVHQLAGCEVHPHAIDAAQLRAHGCLPGAASAAGLDIAALVEAWLYDVGSICRYVKTLAGQSADLRQQQANQARGWLPVRAPGGGGIGRSFYMTPLVATSDAASHATHLYAQLQLHRHCRDGLLALRSTLTDQIDSTAARVQELQGELLPIIEEQVKQEQQLADEAAAEAVAAEAAAAAALSHDDLHPQHALLPDAAHHGQPGAFGGGLFASSGMQLVPPTPLLQQQAASRRCREQQVATGAGPRPGSEAGPLGGAPGQLASLAAAPHGPAAAAAAAAAAGWLHPPALPAAAAGGLGQQPGGLAQPPSGGLGLLPLGPAALAAPEAADGGASPDLMPAPPRARSSGRSSAASSAALPAAELLMSCELMDLDLVSSDGGDNDADGGGGGGCCGSEQGSPQQGGCAGPRGLLGAGRAGLGHDGGGGGGLSAADAADDGGMFTHVRAAANALRRGGAGPNAPLDMSRISFARFSLSGNALSPALAALAAAAPTDARQQDSRQDSGSPRAGSAAGSHGSFSLVPQQQQQQQQQRGGSSSSPKAGGAGGAAAAATGGASASGDASSPPPAGPEAPGNTDGAGGADGGDPGSAQLSSAKPRRLTFAAAAADSASSGSAGSSRQRRRTKQQQQQQQPGGVGSPSLLSTSSSGSSGKDAEGNECDSRPAAQAPSTGQQQQQGGGPSIALLRQRFHSATSAAAHKQAQQ